MAPRRFLDNESMTLPFAPESEDRRKNSSGKKGFEKFKLQVSQQFFPAPGTRKFSLKRVGQV
jgi:hypothetical protein